MPDQLAQDKTFARAARHGTAKPHWWSAAARPKLIAARHPVLDLPCRDVHQWPTISRAVLDRLDNFHFPNSTSRKVTSADAPNCEYKDAARELFEFIHEKFSPRPRSNAFAIIGIPARLNCGRTDDLPTTGRLADTIRRQRLFPNVSAVGASGAFAFTQL